MVAVAKRVCQSITNDGKYQIRRRVDDPGFQVFARNYLSRAFNVFVI